MPEGGEKPKRGNKGGSGCLIVALVLGGLYWMGSSQQEADAARASEERAAAVSGALAAREVTAAELFEAYDANEASAQQRFGGQVLKVSGTVDKVMLDIADDPVVLLKTPNQFMSAQAALAPEAKGAAGGYAKGQKVVLVCSGVSEVAGTPMLRDCVPA